jgi:thymidine kinase
MLSLRDARHGRVISITGPVKSGKSTELERLLNSAQGIIWGRAGKNPNTIVLAKHPLDDVDHPGKIREYDALTTDDPDDIARGIESGTEAVVISGINFYSNPKIVDLVQALALSNRRVYAAGHNLDWDAQPFNHMPSIMALSDEFVITNAPCIERDCQLRATRSRKGDVGERVCLDHHYFDGRPYHKPFLKHQTGGLELFVGSMFASKTTMWLQKMEELRANGIDFEVFKWIGDSRYSERGKVHSPFEKGKIGINSGDASIDAVLVRDAHDIMMYLECRTGNPGIDAANRKRMMRLGQVFIDEGQFLKDLYQVVRVRMYEGYRFYITGLLRTWKMEPFGEIAKLLTVADSINVMHGYCDKCRRQASESQRLMKSGRLWLPADYDEGVIAVGGKEDEGKVSDRYEARCKDCIDIPGRPPLAYEFKHYEPKRLRKK